MTRGPTIEPRTERYETDCSVFHGDSCPDTHPLAVQLWLIAKREYPARCPARSVRLRGMMREAGMLP